MLEAEIPGKAHKEGDMDNMRWVEGRNQGKGNTTVVEKHHTRLVVPFLLDLVASTVVIWFD